MKLNIFFALWLFSAFALFGCETVIDAKLDTGPAQLTVDATITDQPGLQSIRLTQTAAYFDNSPAPTVTGATVSVSDLAGRTFAFTDPDNDGHYVWQPEEGDTLGRIGQTYGLSITYQGNTYRAISTMNRVPPVDSIIFRKQKLNPLSSIEGYQAEFYARDLPGATDYYRIRYFRNGVLQNRARDIITLKDASFPGSANTDGFMFIRPFRQSINPDSLYALNDVVDVEIRSITPEAYAFWQQFAQQITNGGLFATPPANVPTNVVNTNSGGPAATGFFTASAVRSRSARVVGENIRE
ncbi:MAG TPA: DUF4249 domain-containing protein [Spirosoma sp.]|nr:DUF4249 domain-containing protein [Spirosoma sp.]